MQQTVRFAIALAAVATSSMFPSSARADDFVNGSFEAPNIGPATLFDVGGTDMPGWAYVNGYGAIISNGYNGAGTGVNWHDTPSGNQFLYMAQSVADGVTLEQGVNVTAGAHTLNFLQADFASAFETPGGAVLVSILNPHATTLVSPTLFSTPYLSDFIGQSLSFTAPTSGDYEFQFISVGGQAAIIDGVHMDAVPEPCSLIAVGIGFVGIIRRRTVSKRSAVGA